MKRGAELRCTCSRGRQAGKPLMCGLGWGGNGREVMQVVVWCMDVGCAFHTCKDTS